MKYSCKDCGKSGVKLWREYQTFLDHITLRCKDCSQKSENRMLEPGCDQIGWLVPAVPTDDGSFWGYTSVPEHLCKWWKDLPE